MMNDIKYEWGKLDVEDLLQRLAQEGITDAKVEQGSDSNRCIIHLPSADMLIQLDEKSTHILCQDGSQNLRSRLRKVLLQCLQTF